MNMFTKPFIKLAFPPVINIRDLMTKHPDSRASARGPNAFIIYRKIFVETARADGYQLPMTVVSSMASQSWEQESEFVKAEYKRLAKEANDIRNESSPKSPRRPKRERWNIVSFQKPSPVKTKSTLRRPSSESVELSKESLVVEHITPQKVTSSTQTTCENNASTEFKTNNTDHEIPTIDQLYDLFVENDGDSVGCELPSPNFSISDTSSSSPISEQVELNSVDESLNNLVIPHDAQKLEELQFHMHSNDSLTRMGEYDSTSVYLNIDLSYESTWRKMFNDSSITGEDITSDDSFFSTLAGTREFEYQGYMSPLSSPETGNSNCSDSEESTISTDLRSMTQFSNVLGISYPSPETNYNNSFYF
ncbi:2361_t:CDS:1 [Acaulospora colombiana]|uniref:2361_t:CDS:1 n=1 Tax=Acaulospora colombiana TaxID=27376 RepID=A0ACA9LND7_9GLOM|nr:2361_t:CDS:1 [Acaulospora colombiana]